MDGITVAGEVVGAGTALAGLILVYLGAVAAGYDAYQPAEKRTVKSRFQKRALAAFVGFILALIAALLGVLGKWLPNGCIADAGVVLLIISFLWTSVLAFLTVQEID